MTASEIRCLADIVRVNAAERGDRPGLEAGPRVLSFAEFYDRTKAVAGALAGSGVRAQDRVALIERNGIEALEITFGAALLNAVVVHVNWRLAPPEILQIVQDAGAEMVLVGPELMASVEAIEGDLGEKTKVIAIGEHPTWERYDSWLQTYEPTDPGTVAAADDVALQLYTSGTTGLPKGVMLTTKNLTTSFENLKGNWFEPGKSVNLALMPMFHIAGLGWASAGLYNGCRTVVVRDVVPAEILRTLEDRQITRAFMVPAVIQILLQSPEIEHADFSKLEKIVYGASPISAAVVERAMEVFGCDFVQVYGLTETTGAITELPAGDHDPVNRPGLLRSCGKPYPWVELKIVDSATGDEAKTGQVGELWTRSDLNMAGYWNNPDATKAVLDADGWFRTGDAGYLDEDGYVYLHDRVKDMIVTGGENVYPAEVENAMMRHPAIADVAVFGVPDDKWGEAVKATVVLQSGQEPTADELIAFCREQLAGYKCPKSIDFATTLPRNPSGKLLKRELRAPYWEGRDRQVG